MGDHQSSDEVDYEDHLLLSDDYLSNDVYSDYSSISSDPDDGDSDNLAVVARIDRKRRHLSLSPAAAPKAVKRAKMSRLFKPSTIRPLFDTKPRDACRRLDRSMLENPRHESSPSPARSVIGPRHQEEITTQMAEPGPANLGPMQEKITSPVEEHSKTPRSRLEYGITTLAEIVPYNLQPSPIIDELVQSQVSS